VSRVNRIFNFLFSLQREEGQTMAEYGVVLAVITVGIVAALGALALAISGKLGNVTNVLKSSL
jgi:Flp pilus assembly pilin Flp